MAAASGDEYQSLRVLSKLDFKGHDIRAIALHPFDQLVAVATEASVGLFDFDTKECVRELNQPVQAAGEMDGGGGSAAADKGKGSADSSSGADSDDSGGNEGGSSDSDGKDGSFSGRNLLFSSDGVLLATLGRTAQVWRVSDGSLLHTMPLRRPTVKHHYDDWGRERRDPGFPYEDVTFLVGNTGLLVQGYSKGLVAVWHFGPNTVSLLLDSRGGSIQYDDTDSISSVELARSVALSHHDTVDDQLVAIATGSEDGSRTAVHNVKQDPSAHPPVLSIDENSIALAFCKGDVLAIAWTDAWTKEDQEDPKYLGPTSCDSVVLCNVRSKTRLQRLKTAAGLLLFQPNTQRLLVACPHRLCLWDVEAGTRIQRAEIGYRFVLQTDEAETCFLLRDNHYRTIFVHAGNLTVMGTVKSDVSKLCINGTVIAGYDFNGPDRESVKIYAVCDMMLLFYEA
eukprot:m.23685 g.23685  ORF g.23685 m.23685 type:complete len:453 (-) comp7256_c0_seq2:298-1656(-)